MTSTSKSSWLRRRTSALLVGLVSAALVLSGCSVYDAPLPGGANTGDNPMTIKVMFRDVLDLVPQSTVKVNDVTVGKVKKVDLKGYVAEVTLEIPGDVKLPDNARAEIRQTSLLGEKFVQLSEPRDPGTGKLANNDVIGLDRTGRNPEVEEVLGALSLLLNGGGVGQLKTIFSELNNALEGREPQVRSVLTQLRSFMGQLDDEQGVHRRRPREHQPPGAGDPPQRRRDQGRARRHPGRAAIGGQPTRRPGQAAPVADPAQRGRRAGDPGVEGVDDQQPAAPRAGARGVRQGRGQLRQVLPGVR